MEGDNENQAPPKESQPSVGSQTKQKRDKKRWVIIALVVLLVLLLAAAAGYLYWRFEESKRQVSQRDADKTSLESALAACREDGKEDGAEPAPAGDDSPSVSDADLPVVIFSPGGLFTDAEKNEIITKMVNPYKAWQSDAEQQVVSIHIQQDTDRSNQYIVDAIFRNSVYEGFLYGTVDAAVQDWWTPTCLDACEFSAEFQAQFPEVVDATTP